MKVLICESNIILLNLLEQIFEKMNYEVFSADNGLKASELLEEYEIDVLLTAILVPLKSGLELVMDAKQKNQKIKTIILSQINEPRYIQQALNIGADDFITKPFDPELIVDRINKMLLRTL